MGQVVTIGYDHLDRAISRTFTEVPSPTWAHIKSVSTDYDDNGNVTKVAQDYVPYAGQAGNPDDEETFAYDHLDRRREKNDVHGVLVSWEYNDNGTKLSVADDSTFLTTDYGYDAVNRLAAVTTDAGVATYTYTLDNLRNSITYPSLAVSSYGYDLADRVTSIATRDDGGTLISSFGYQYDKNGNRTQEDQDRQGVLETATFGDGTPPGTSPASGYDEVNRLQNVTYKSGSPNARTVSYGYDAAGIRPS